MSEYRTLARHLRRFPAPAGLTPDGDGTVVGGSAFPCSHLG